jgi:hypothetical protein
MFGMPRGRALVWKPGDEAPRMAWVKGYFEIPELAARASPNPYYTGGGWAAVPAAVAAVGRRFGKAVKVTAAAGMLAFAGFAFLPHAPAKPHPEKPVPARVDHPPKAHPHAPRNLGH